MCRACPIPCRALAYLGGFACTIPEYLCDVQVSQFDQVGVAVKMEAKDSARVCVCVRVCVCACVRVCGGQSF